MSKPRVLVCVLCGRERDSWINPALFRSLLNLQDARFDVTIDLAYDLKPYEFARNTCMMNAKLGGYDYLVQIDNDMVLPAAFADVLHETVSSGKHVVGLKAGAFDDDGSLRMLSCHYNGMVEQLPAHRLNWRGRADSQLASMAHYSQRSLVPLVGQ